MICSSSLCLLHRILTRISLSFFFLLLGCNRKLSGITWMLLYLCNENLDVRQETWGSRQLSEMILAVHLESTWPAVARWAAAGVAGNVTNKTVLSMASCLSWACSLCRAAASSPMHATLPWLEAVASKKFLVLLEGFGKVCKQPPKIW